MFFLGGAGWLGARPGWDEQAGLGSGTWGAGHGWLGWGWAGLGIEIGCQ